jgi:hypothetical protein
MKKFTVPCQFGAMSIPIALYVAEPVDGEDPLEQQVAWWARERGGTVPAEVLDRFAQVHRIAGQAGVSFEELAVRALGTESESDDDLEPDDQSAAVDGFHFDSSGRLRQLTEAELLAADADADSSIICRDQGVTSDGRPYWVYIKVRPSMYSEFMRLSEAGETKIFADYGTILKYGFDEEVPAEIRQQMAVEHGSDDNYMESLAERIKNAQTVFLAAQEERRIRRIAARLAGPA